MGKLVHGVGVYEKGKWSGSVEGVHTKEYILWRNMLERCYSSKFHLKNPTYQGCTVSDNFKNFQYFAEWCNNQIGYHLPKRNLDKDILVKGNRTYSEYVCVFIPQGMNTFLVNKHNFRGEYPVGVSYCAVRGKYSAGMRFKQKNIFIGRYDTKEDAFEAYRLRKISQAKQLAEEHKDFIDTRVYNALLNFNIEITD